MEIYADVERPAVSDLMASTTELTTAEQLAAFPVDGRRYELVAGELREMAPAGNEHGRVAIRLGWRIAQFVEQHQLGATFAAETGFLLSRSPDTVRAPDFAFVCQARLDDVGSVSGYWPGAPDLLAEVISANDTFSQVESKVLGWLAAGTKVVWVLDPFQRHVTEYRSQNRIAVLEPDDSLSAPDLLPGWQVRVAELF